ncbi:FkbM family methyltransferase [Sedimentitalea sp. HM32M-2]|uniref:FkbM family methyltransferase n=1 Tax=Sedimentitalea sp. HM32M-2 TaxID=3351566 RepID=UPI003639D276
MSLLRRSKSFIRRRLDPRGHSQFRRLRGQERCSPAQVRALFSLFQPFDTGIPLIRIGGDHDGGYLLPDDLDGIVASFSPGVDVTVTFDAEIAERGIPCFMADASVQGIAVDHPLLTFDRLFVGATTEGDVISMQDWIGKYAPPEGDLLMQMDIEGAEYDTIMAMRDADLDRFRIIVLELHDLQDAFVTGGNARLGAFMRRLTERFVICHIHPNNYARVATIDGISFPTLPEVTLLRRDRVRADLQPTDQIPHPLDQPNVPENPDWACPRFWAG